MSIGDLRYTVLQTVNEVLDKIGLNQVSSLSANKVSKELVYHINDVVDDLSDFGNWLEVMTTAKVTAHTSIRDYTIPTSAVIKNIGDIYLSNRRGPLTSVDIDTMRILTRTTSMGDPSQYCLWTPDSNGNPTIRVRPTPDSSTNGQIFSILYFTKPSLYTVSDGAVIIPFPARVVVLGVLARYTLRESGGAPTPMYQSYQQQYMETRKTSINRFQGNTGWNLSFNPGYYTRRRR